jgi:hypothetical protein
MNITFVSFRHICVTLTPNLHGRRPPNGAPIKRLDLSRSSSNVVNRTFIVGGFDVINTLVSDNVLLYRATRTSQPCFTPYSLCGVQSMGQQISGIKSLIRESRSGGEGRPYGKWPEVIRQHPFSDSISWLILYKKHRSIVSKPPRSSPYLLLHSCDYTRNGSLAFRCQIFWVSF